MSQLFSLDAQSCGFERHVTASGDGFGIVVHRDGESVRASSPSDALNIASRYIGDFLRPAQRGGRPWGLKVSVSGGQAVYGEWPLSGGGGGGASFQNTPLVRIRNRWRDSSPMSALENAIAIIREYIPRRRAA